MTNLVFWPDFIFLGWAVKERIVKSALRRTGLGEGFGEGEGEGEAAIEGVGEGEGEGEGKTDGLGVG